MVQAIIYLMVTTLIGSIIIMFAAGIAGIVWRLQ